jgi:hypothetical protein
MKKATTSEFDAFFELVNRVLFVLKTEILRREAASEHTRKLTSVFSYHVYLGVEGGSHFAIAT